MKRVHPLGSMNVLANFSIRFCKILWAKLASRPESGTKGKFIECPKEKGSYCENYEYPQTLVFKDNLIFTNIKKMFWRFNICASQGSHQNHGIRNIKSRLHCSLYSSDWDIIRWRLHTWRTSLSKCHLTATRGHQSVKLPGTFRDWSIISSLCQNQITIPLKVWSPLRDP